ncbi:hypothetical protein [Alkalihalobacillus deserti]|uniref:hypothetical protein n=1 Tax=Alkalihalobacillus deserti TaxID=2879466 RepID=UPI001D134B15|nr:hypothetical protein [Alkalihalobacillus deserti]
MTYKRSSDVFGMSNTILSDSYIDRGNLDTVIQRYLDRRTHIALRGESKCGKSWFRQKNIPDAIVVQCRFGKSVKDIYTDALSQLGIKLIVEETNGSNILGRVEANASIGTSLLAKLGVKSTIESSNNDGTKAEVVGRDINDLKFIADIIINSGKRLVIEDFHYLSIPERKAFSYDLKALWDYGCFIVIIGVWSQSNMLLDLNPDLSGRIYEMSIYWSPQDLKQVIEKGSKALKIEFSDEIIPLLISDCFGNIGLLQNLVLHTLDIEEIFEEQAIKKSISNISNFDLAAAAYANQLDSLYQKFASRVSTGIRSRNDSTGIYAHAMAVIVEADNDKLINGLGLNEIYEIAHSRQPRIQKGNLRTILGKLEELQVDSEGRGLVLAYNNSTDEITAVDRQLLFYRKHLTLNWPWEEMISELQA